MDENNKKILAKLLHFHIFSTLSLSQLYLFSSMKIQRTNISHFFKFYLKSALPIFMDENTSVASFPYFFNFNLKSALPILSMKIPRLYLGTNLLHFPFFPLLPWVGFTSFHR